MCILFMNGEFPSLSKLWKPAEVTIDKTPVIITQVKAIAQLITISAYDEIVVDSTAQVPSQLSLPFLKPIKNYPSRWSSALEPPY